MEQSKTPLLDFFKGHPERWTTKTHARNMDDSPVPHYHPSACKWCLEGRIACQYPTTLEYTKRELIREKLYKAIHKLFPINEKVDLGWTISGINDRKGFDAVIQLLEEAQV